MEAAIYARVSTTDQNCAPQLNELSEYIRRHAWEAVANTWTLAGAAPRPADWNSIAYDRLRRRRNSIASCFGKLGPPWWTAQTTMKALGKNVCCASPVFDTGEKLFCSEGELTSGRPDSKKEIAGRVGRIYTEFP